MEINYINLYGVLTAVASVALLAYLIPKQVVEVRRPRNGFSALRTRLLIQSILGIVLLSPRIPFFISRLHADIPSIWQCTVSVATSTVLFFFIYNMYKSYTYKERE